MSSYKDKTNEKDDSDSDMGIEEMALFVKKFKNFFNKRQQDQSSSLGKIKENLFDKVKSVRKSIDKSSQKQYFECHDFGHIATDCPNKKKNQRKHISKFVTLRTIYIYLSFLSFFSVIVHKKISKDVLNLEFFVNLGKQVA